MAAADAPRSAANPVRVTGYCGLRLPVRELKRSLTFYCDLVGYVQNQPEGAVEAFIEPAAGSGPGLYLMQATESEFRHIHWRQWGRLHTAFELLVDDLPALHRRLLDAGIELDGDPAYKGGYLTLGFFDPDGHYLFAVDRRGRYFSLKADIEALLGRALSDSESERLQRAGAATEPHDELAVVQAVVTELKARVGGGD